MTANFHLSNTCVILSITCQIVGKQLANTTQMLPCKMKNVVVNSKLKKFGGKNEKSSNLC